MTHAPGSHRLPISAVFAVALLLLEGCDRTPTAPTTAAPSSGTVPVPASIPSLPPPAATKPVRDPTSAEAVTAAFGPGVGLAADGSFTWTVAKTQALPWKENEGNDVRGRSVKATVQRFEPLPAGEGGASGPRWLLVTAGPTLSGNQPDDCHGCGAIVSAFVLARTPVGALAPEVAAPVLAQAGSFGGSPEVDIVATGPARRAIRLESGYTGQGYTNSWQDYHDIGPGFPSLLSRPLTVHGDNEGVCSKNAAERARDPSLKACETADTTVRFVPAKAGETDDPTRWVLEATTNNPNNLSDEGVLPMGVARLPFRGGKYQVPAAPGA